MLNDQDKTKVLEAFRQAAEKPLADGTKRPDAQILKAMAEAPDALGVFEHIEDYMASKSATLDDYIRDVEVNVFQP